MATKKSDLSSVVDIINKVTGRTYTLEYAYGRPRLCLDHREISPRLPRGTMQMWLEAFEAGIRAGFESV